MYQDGDAMPADDAVVMSPDEIVAEINALLSDKSLTPDDLLTAICTLLADNDICGEPEEDLPTDPAAIPVDGADMAEQIRTGSTRRQSAAVRESASRLLESLGGRPIPGTAHATDRAARVAEMIRTIKRR